MCDFGKRIAGLAAFFVMAAALVPLWSLGQSTLEYRVNITEDELKALRESVKDVPSQIILINNKMDTQAQSLKETKESVEAIKVAAFTSMAAILAFLASWVFNLFGGRAARDRAGDRMNDRMVDRVGR